MSTVFTAWCDTDEEAGPELQRTAGGSSLIDPAAWSAWLIEHEQHELALLSELDAASRIVRAARAERLREMPIKANRGRITF